MKIEKLDDLRAWQHARALANLIYDATGEKNFARDFELRNQIQAAAGSVMHNIAEGFDARSDGEFILFLKHARRSTSEIQSEIYLALDRKYMTETVFQQTHGKATKVTKIINALIAYLRKSRSSRKPK